MAINRRTQGKKDTQTETIPAGEYDARLVMVADLGIIHDSYQGEEKENQKLCLGIEIIGQTVTVGEEVKPLILWDKAFNIFSSTNPKSNEFKKVQVFCPSFTGEDGEAFDWESALGEPCSATLDEERGYNNIVSLVGIPARFAEHIGLPTAPMAAGSYADEPIASHIYGLPLWLVKNRGELSPQAGEKAFEQAAHEKHMSTPYKEDQQTAQDHANDPIHDEIPF